MTAETALPHMLRGLDMRSFLGQAGGPEPAVTWALRGADLLEQICMYHEGSLVDVGDAGLTLGDVVVPAEQILERVAVQAGALAFADVVADYRRAIPARLDLSAPGAARLLLTTLLRFVTAPTDDEVAVFGAWIQDDNRATGRAEVLTDGVPTARLPYMTGKEILELPMTQVYWPFAAVRNDASLVEAIRSFTEGSSQLAYGAATALDVRVLVDHGDGLAARSRHTVQRNGRGLSMLDIHLDEPGVKSVSVVFGDDRGLVRLDWLQLRYTVGETDPIAVHLGDAQGLSAFAAGGRVVPGSRVIVGETSPPSIAYRFPTDSGAVYNVEMELGWAYMPLTPPENLPGTGA
jgi:hypothetical protein